MGGDSHQPDALLPAPSRPTRIPREVSVLRGVNCCQFPGAEALLIVPDVQNFLFLFFFSFTLGWAFPPRCSCPSYGWDVGCCRGHPARCTASTENRGALPKVIP